MALFITKTRSQRKDGKRYPHYQLRENLWDKDAKAVKQRYVAYIGKEPRLTLEKAKRICAEKGLSLEELRAVKGLEIVEDRAELM